MRLGRPVAGLSGDTLGLGLRDGSGERQGGRRAGRNGWFWRTTGGPGRVMFLQAADGLGRKAMHHKMLGSFRVGWCFDDGGVFGHVPAASKGTANYGKTGLIAQAT